MVTIWVISLAFLNLSHQIASFLRAFLIFLSTFSLFTVPKDLDYRVHLSLSIFAIFKDLITALSILYLHHRMGMKEMGQMVKIDVYKLIDEEREDQNGIVGLRVRSDGLHLSSLSSHQEVEEVGEDHFENTLKNCSFVKMKEDLGFTSFQVCLYDNLQT